MSITVAADSKVQYIGATKDLLVTTSSEVRELIPPSTMAIGDTIEGIPIGAIKCSFHHRDASYGGSQFMWRGRWACMAGRNREELENAVEDDGAKRFAYIHVSPISLPE